jgi:DNA polymerase III epsilon subunit-like protein
MSTTATAQYFQRRTNMSRQNCSYLLEYFRLDAETGEHECVSVYEDGLAYCSAPVPFPVPVLAEPSTASAYASALKKAQASAKKRKEKADIEKALRKAVDAMRKGLAALAQPAPQPVPQPALPAAAALVSLSITADKQVKQVDKPVEASLPQLVEAAVLPMPAAGLLDDITVLDLEFQGDNLLEIAAIRYQHFEPVAEYVSLVRFHGQVWAAVTQVTGITTLHVSGNTLPSEKAALQQFKKLAGDSLLVCHSIGADKRVLEAARTRAGATSELANPWLCTLALARRRIKLELLPKTQKCGLGELCQHFNLKTRGAHRAKADVQMCFGLLRALHQQQAVSKADLHGAPVAGKGRKSATVATPGLLFEAA